MISINGELISTRLEETIHIQSSEAEIITNQGFYKKRHYCIQKLTEAEELVMVDIKYYLTIQRHLTNPHEYVICNDKEEKILI